MAKIFCESDTIFDISLFNFFTIFFKKWNERIGGENIDILHQEFRGVFLPSLKKKEINFSSLFKNLADFIANKYWGNDFSVIKNTRLDPFLITPINFIEEMVLKRNLFVTEKDFSSFYEEAILQFSFILERKEEAQLETA